MQSTKNNSINNSTNMSAVTKKRKIASARHPNVDGETPELYIALFGETPEYTRMLMERHPNYPYYKDTNQLIVGCNQWEIEKEKEMRYEREYPEIDKEKLREYEREWLREYREKLREYEREKREQAQQEKQHRLKKKLGWTMLN